MYSDSVFSEDVMYYKAWMGIRAFCLASMWVMSVSVSIAQPSADDAARILEQTTFGPNAASIARVQALGFAGFLDEQFTLPASSYPALALQPTTVPSTCTGTCVRDNYSMYPIQLTFFKNAL